MARPRWRKVVLDLWDHKARTLLVVASIAVGVFAVGVIAGSYSIILQDLARSYTSVNPANITIVTDPFDTDFVASVRHLNGVADAEGRSEFTVRVRTGSDRWDSLTLIAYPDFQDIRINQLLPQQGAPAPNDREVVLERQTMSKLHAAVGDTLEIELPDGKLRQVRVAGSAQELTSGYSGILGDFRGYVTTGSLEWLEQPATLNRLYVTVAGNPNDKAHIEQVAQAVTDQVDHSGRQVYRTELARQDTHPLESLLQALLGVLSILGVLIVFLSGSLIANTMSALLAEHVRQIGVMKLIGARRIQIVGMYVAQIATYGALALAVAIPLGSWGAYALSSFAANVINFVMQGYRVVPSAMLLQVAIALLVPPAAGLLPVLRGSGTTVHQALHSNESGREPSRRSWIDRGLVRLRWVSRPLRLSIRNTFRRKTRLALTLLTLTLGGAVFIAVFNSQVALDQKVVDITRYFRADVNLDLARSYRIDQVTPQALAIPGVERVETWTSTTAKLLHADGSIPDNVAIIAPPADSELITPVLLQGRWLVPGDENAITVNEAFWKDYPTLRAGDRLRLKIAGHTDDWVVVGIFQYTGVDQLIAYANYDRIAQLLKEPYQASAYRLVTADHSLSAQQNVGDALDRLLRERGFRVSNVEAGGTRTASVTNMLGILTAFLLVMALLTAAVGCIGLAGTMSMNVLERTREIGVLRAIGAYDRFIVKLVVVEGLIIGLISYVLAAVVSFPITGLLSNTISLAIFKSPANVAFTAQGFVIWLAVVLVLSAFASILPARNASRLTIREVLAYE